MKKDRTQQVFLVFAILCVLLVLYSAYYLLGIVIPRSAARDFGTPDNGLDYSQRVLYALRLEMNKGDFNAVDAADTNSRLFTITYGESAAQIAAALAEQGLIRSADIFTDYLIYRGYDRQLQAGIYSLNRAMTALEIGSHLVDENPADVAFSFLPGWRAEEIAGLLPSSGLAISADDFLQAVRQPEDAGFLVPAEATSLEGFLFPSEYPVMRNADAQELIDRMVTRFYEQLPVDFDQHLSANGLDLYEGIILASLVQKEMVLPEEGPLIASVFINRLRAGMPLQSDPTVQYALGYDADSASWWKNPLSEADLQVQSPFNTYIHSGLPPAPICNPGLPALLSAIDAEQTSYLYFRAACDGSGRHVFSETYAQHLAAACQ